MPFIREGEYRQGGVVLNVRGVGAGCVVVLQEEGQPDVRFRFNENGYPLKDIPEREPEEDPEEDSQ